MCIITLPGKSESSISVGEHKVLVLETGGISDAAQKAYMKGDPSVMEKEKKNLKESPDPQSLRTFVFNSSQIQYLARPRQNRHRLGVRRHTDAAER